MDFDMFSLAVYAALILAVAIGGLTLSILVGRRRKGFIKEEPYESGVPQIGETRTEYNVRFFLLALIFMLFDIEVLLLAPYAVTFIDDVHGGKGLEYGAVAGVFLVVLTMALVYEWRKGVLDWSKPLGASNIPEEEAGQDVNKAA